MMKYAYIIAMTCLTAGSMTALPYSAAQAADTPSPQLTQEQLAQALSLDQAKSQGLVGERPDGLLGAVPANPSAEVQSLVASINAQRMDAYRQIAAQNGVSVEETQIVVGERVISQAAPGTFIYIDGSWIRK